LATHAITTLQEKGVAAWVIQAQVGHVSPAMMKTYSHIRQMALNQAAAALEPTHAAFTAVEHSEQGVAASDRPVTSQTTSHSETDCR